MKILIIEDDKVALKTLQYSLEGLGHNVCIAENGEEAIQKTANAKLDIIISDAMMPGISGLSLIKVLRTMSHSKTPIIMMSALNNKPLQDAALEAGADDFISKPFSMEEITKVLKNSTRAVSRFSLAFA